MIDIRTEATIDLLNTHIFDNKLVFVLDDFHNEIQPIYQRVYARPIKVNHKIYLACEEISRIISSQQDKYGVTSSSIIVDGKGLGAGLIDHLLTNEPSCFVYTI